MRVAGFEFGSVVDGPGVRNVVFMQGCTHHCPGCHNPGTHSFTGGKYMPVEAVADELLKHWTDASDPCITISGGEPFNQPHELKELCRILKIRHAANIWCYTGYLWESLLTYRYDVLKYVDVLVDGPFVESLKTLDSPFRGSSNQRTVDCAESLAGGRVALWEPERLPEFEYFGNLEGTRAEDEKGA